VAKPVCSKCGHEFFSASNIEAIGLKHRLTMVHCARCGTVVGVLDSENFNEVVTQLQEKLEDMEFKISYLIK
jgi:DNA-directed RNA polymerase subunit RPC12/RpoP